MAVLHLISVEPDETDTFDLRAVEPDDACDVCDSTTPIMLVDTSSPTYLLLCMRHAELDALRIAD